MTIGAGKYDDLCTEVRAKACAAGAIVIVIGGEHGHGFSVHASPELTARLPELLEWVALEMRADVDRLFTS
jgi:hypothetical protein